MSATLQRILLVGLLLLGSGPLRASAQDLDPQQLAAPASLPERTVGEASAPVTVIEYASLSCHHCARFHTRTWPALKTKYVDTGMVRFIFRDFPIEPLALAAAMLTRCSEDGKWSQMLDRLYQTQREWSHSAQPLEALAQVAADAGMTRPEFERCLDDKWLMNDILNFARRGIEFGVASTPTFFVNGQMHSGALTIDQFDKILEPLLAGNPERD